MLGLPDGRVVLVGYCDDWPRLFEEERAALSDALGGRAECIEHVGSTAVPGLPAKPVLDIAVAVEKLSVVQSFVGPLAELGYTYRGEYGLPGRLFFTKGSPVTHHVHAVERGSEHWRVWRRFRDYLRSHVDECARYAAVKLDLAERYASDRDAYTQSKSEYIISVLEKAGATDEDAAAPG